MKIDIWVQPIYRVSDLNVKIEFVEVLARCGDLDGGMTSGKAIVQYVKRNKLQTEMDLFIFGELHKIKVPDSIRICVNVFSETLAVKEIARTLSEIVLKSGVAPQRIIIELNEETDIYDDNVIENIRIFKRNGFKIALDDFGKQNANIDFLLKCPLDLIKVDREIINPKSTISYDAHKEVCRAILNMIRAMGADKIVEGVETCEQLSMVRDAGFNKIQGFLLSRPIKLSALHSVDMS